MFTSRSLRDDRRYRYHTCARRAVLDPRGHLKHRTTRRPLRQPPPHRAPQEKEKRPRKHASAYPDRQHARSFVFATAKPPAFAPRSTMPTFFFSHSGVSYRWVTQHPTGVVELICLVCFNLLLTVVVDCTALHRIAPQASDELPVAGPALESGEHSHGHVRRHPSQRGRRGTFEFHACGGVTW